MNRTHACSCTQSTSTRARAPIAAPVAFAFTIMMCATNLAQAQTIQPMNLAFTHRLGAVIPAHQIRLEVWEQDDLSADDFIGNYVTGNNGQALVITNEDDGVLDFTLELYAFPRSYAPGIARVTARAVGSNSYMYRSPAGTGTYPATIGAVNPAVNLVTATNSTFGEAAFGILQPVVYSAQWFSTNLAVAAPEIDILYDGTATEPATMQGGNYFQALPNARGVNFINIHANDWASWDVIGHEYMHYIANTQSLDPGFGGGHTVGTDNIPNGATVAQKNRGTGLAWNEGIATFMYEMAVRDGNMNANFNNQLASRDFDTWYTKFNAPGTTAGTAQVTFEYDLETIAYHTRNGGGVLGQHLSAADSRGEGEGDELSVQRALWDMYDPTGEAHTGDQFTGYYSPGRSDKVAFGAAPTWQQALKGADNAGNKRFQDSWDDITTYLGTAAGKTGVGLAAAATQYQAVTRVGEILEEYNISSLPDFGTTDLATLTGLIKTPDRSPELDWIEQANGRTDLHRLLVFNDQWSIKYDSGNILDVDVDTTGFYSHDIPMANELRNGLYYWVALNNPDLRQAAALRDNLIAGIPNQADLLKYYWSGANAFQIIPEPSTALLAMLAFAAFGGVHRRCQRFIFQMNA